MAQKKGMFSIGLMSGTSMDGIDAALLQTDGTPYFIEELASDSLDYDNEFKLILKATEYSIHKNQGNLDKVKINFQEDTKEYLQINLNANETQVSEKHQALTDYLRQRGHQGSHYTLEDVITLSTNLHAQVVIKLLRGANLPSSSIDVIGYHGQTMFHQPHSKCSVILGDGQSLANQLTVTVVDDFRSKDLELGGIGAPFAPLYHQALAKRDNTLPLGVINCGGIANITVIPNDKPEDLIGFDTGPGNALIDRFIRLRSHGQLHMDKDGQLARKGKVNQTVLKKLYEKSIIIDGNNFFHKPPPKCLDHNDIQLIPEVIQLSAEDGLATLAAFTADSIIQSMSLAGKTLPEKWVLAGGGWNNPVLLGEFKNRLSKLSGSFTILSSNEINWNLKALEAQLFAYLAVRRLKNRPISYPNITQAKQEATGGTIYQPQ